MGSDVRIDYEKLATDYMRSLTTVLRGFKSGVGHEFLDTWVRDEDDTRSVLGIIEAAKDSGLPSVSIHLGPAILSKVDMVRLRELAGREGDVASENSADGIDVTVSFLGQTAQSSDIPRQRRLAQLPVEESRHLPMPVPAEVAPAVVLFDSRKGALNPVYKQALLKAAQSRAHEGELKAEDGSVMTQSAHQGVKLMAAVEPLRHIVRKAAYQGAAAPAQRGLMETLCELMTGKPILECSDHSVILLEFELRDHSMSRSVPGIMMPENADAMFALPTVLMHGILADYRRKTGFKSIENFYDQPISDSWRALSTEARMQRLREAIAQHPAGRGGELVSLETPKRVVVGFLEDIDGATRQSCLMRLEEHLKRTLERTLQLYVEPKVDQNKLRRPKGITAP
jgi:hypothetical protein